MRPSLEVCSKCKHYKDVCEKCQFTYCTTCEIHNSCLETKSIFDEALTIVQGDRRDAYGPIYDSFANIAKVWSVCLKHEVTPIDVAKCMIGMKLVREANKHQHDNLVDICGYTYLLNQLHLIYFKDILKKELGGPNA